MFAELHERVWQDITLVLPVAYIGLYLGMFFHECGHYVMGKIVLPNTLKITAFSVGHLLVVYDRIHGSTRFVIRAILNPFGDNYVLIEPTGTEPVTIIRYKWVLFITAGIMANFIWAGICFVLYLATSHLTIFILSLTSFSVGAGQIFASDGMRVWRAFVHKEI